ncbi:hypothetical protein EW026_g6062 [Hermanssonia centrifuga]|uniref:Protein kinase domain-containing protein n=1 Tax=Hermanssonia centrifuga TaxID=98765 RepID=A0A4S4KD55_9APHY|nr:hypothetical protein EW026_g6062 [Hermanssonia centrifuga]
MDATREIDGAKVFIKAVKRSTRELDFPFCFSPNELQDDSCNHFLPALQLLDDPLDAETVLVITPYVRPYDNPGFSTLEEVFDFMEQTLKGLQHMHDQGMAHRNCDEDAIVMDARSLYPKGHHPLDIFILGNLFYDLLDRYRGLVFLKALPYEMTRDIPELRPTALTAYNLLQKLKASVPAWELRWRLEPPQEGYWIGVARDCRALTRELTYHVNDTLHNRDR